MAVSTDALDLHRLAQLLPAIRNLVGDDSVTEIMITCHPTRGVLVFFEKKGLLYRAPLKDVARRDVEGFCHSVSRPLGSNLQDKPLVDARLADGSRVAIAVPPASPRGPAVTIRRFSKVRYSGADLVGFGSLPMAVFELLVDAVKKGGNILVAGGTGSGKTTLLNALIAEFAPDDRLVVIEDVIELKIDHPNIVRLEARGLEGKNMTARDMVRHALRQRPDHIVLGEVRGAEAYDVLQALNTGHGGSMTTIHANTARDALLRMASCALEGAGSMPWPVIATSVAMAFDIVVYQHRRLDRSRGVSDLLRVTGYDRNSGEWTFEELWKAPPHKPRALEPVEVPPPVEAPRLVDLPAPVDAPPSVDPPADVDVDVDLDDVAAVGG